MAKLKNYCVLNFLHALPQVKVVVIVIVIIGSRRQQTHRNGSTFFLIDNQIISQRTSGSKIAYQNETNVVKYNCSFCG